MTSPSESSAPAAGLLDARQPETKITAAQREVRNGHRGLVIWLTGLSGAGKTTVGTELERRLFQSGRHTYLLDGDILRRGLNMDLGFGSEARRENIRRAGEVAALFADAGCIVIAAFISPFREDRDRIRRSLPQGCFIEVYINAPLEICEQRDVKGLYARARANQIKEFTGVSSSYEPPLKPEIEVRTDRLPIAETVETILAYLARVASANTPRQ